MKRILFSLLILVLAIPVSAQWYSNPHDCCDTDCPGASTIHSAEAAISGGGCIIPDGVEWWCKHQWGMQVYGGTGLENCRDMFGSSFNGTGCAKIWCNVNGAWKTKLVGMGACTGTNVVMEVKADGIRCYRDNNEDLIYNGGDVELIVSNCSNN